MKVIILTEAGKNIGMGHISRCCSLYDELIRQGFDVEFIIDSEMNDFEMLEGRNYKVTNWKSTAFINQYVTEEVYSIIDSYTVDVTFLDFIERHSYSCLFIDDVGRVNYPKGIVVNPSLNTEHINYPSNPAITYLLGNSYVILRSAFVDSRRQYVNDNVSHVLITMGGSDLHDITSKLLNRIVKTETHIHFHVVLGNGYQNKNKMLQNAYSNVTFYENLNDKEMQSLMLKCDLAITAAGQTIYELLATKTPFIPIQTADNQKNNINGLKKFDIIDNHISIKESNYIDEVIHTYNKMKQFDVRKIQIDKNVIDGKGTKRIINNILRTFYSLRNIEEKDMEAVFRLSNQDYVRKYSIHKERINWEEHVQWFNKILASENDHFFVITNSKNEFLGQIRYKVEKDSAVVSISIGESLVGKGLSRYFLQKSMDLLRDRERNLTKIIAYISNENIASQRLFTKAGFTYLTSENDMQKYEHILTKR